MIIRYSQMHRTDKYSQHRSIISPIWLNDWVFIYEVSGCQFECRCSQLNFRYGTCFEQGVFDIQENYRVYSQHSSIVFPGLVKWLSVHLWIRWLWFPIPLLPLKPRDMEPASKKEFLHIQTNYRVCIHSETCVCPDNGIKRNLPYI